MLLRSSSAPILNSWLPNSKDSSSSSSSSSQSEPEATNLHLPRTKSVPFSCSLHFSSLDDRSTKRPISSTFDHSPPKPKRQSSKIRAQKQQQQEQEQQQRSQIMSIESLVSSSGLGEKGSPRRASQTLVAGGGDGGGGRGSGGGDSGGFGFGSGSFEGNNPGSESTEAYYLKMIEANPGNSLVLGNYAKFLKEVRGDYGKAEEYCGRAILANPNDADALSLYADLIWITQKDSQRAENYFDQAVKTSPDDCYVLASYARFLWDAEDDEDHEEKKDERYEIDHSRSSQSTFFHGEALTA